MFSVDLSNTDTTNISISNGRGGTQVIRISNGGDDSPTTKILTRRGHNHTVHISTGRGRKNGMEIHFESSFAQTSDCEDDGDNEYEDDEYEDDVYEDDVYEDDVYEDDGYEDDQNDGNAVGNDASARDADRKYAKAIAPMRSRQHWDQRLLEDEGLKQKRLSQLYSLERPPSGPCEICRGSHWHFDCVQYSTWEAEMIRKGILHEGWTTPTKIGPHWYFECGIFSALDVWQMREGTWREWTWPSKLGLQNIPNFCQVCRQYHAPIRVRSFAEWKAEIIRKGITREPRAFQQPRPSETGHQGSGHKTGVTLPPNFLRQLLPKAPSELAAPRALLVQLSEPRQLAPEGFRPYPSAIPGHQPPSVPSRLAMPPRNLGQGNGTGLYPPLGMPPPGYRGTNGMHLPRPQGPVMNQSPARAKRLSAPSGPVANRSLMDQRLGY